MQPSSRFRSLTDVTRRLDRTGLADASVAALAEARRGALLRFGRVLCGSDALAQDLVQEALARALVTWRRQGCPSDPEAYVRRAMVNLYTSLWSRRLRFERAVAEVPDSTVSADTLGDPVQQRLVWIWLGSLPPRQRAVIVLRYYEELTASEVSEVLGCSTGTVKSQASRAIKRLRMTPLGLDSERQR